MLLGQVQVGHLVSPVRGVHGVETPGRFLHGLLVRAPPLEDGRGSVGGIYRVGRNVFQDCKDVFARCHTAVVNVVSSLAAKFLLVEADKGMRSDTCLMENGKKQLYTLKVSVCYRYWGGRELHLRENVVRNVDHPGDVRDGLQVLTHVRVLGLGEAEDGVRHVYASQVTQEVGELDPGAPRGLHVLEAVVALEQVASHELESRDLQQAGHDGVKNLGSLPQQARQPFEHGVGLSLAVEEAPLKVLGLFHAAVILAHDVVVLNDEPGEEPNVTLHLYRVTGMAELLRDVPSARYLSLSHFIHGNFQNKNEVLFPTSKRGFRVA